MYLFPFVIYKKVYSSHIFTKKARSVNKIRFQISTCNLGTFLSVCTTVRHSPLILFFNINPQPVCLLNLNRTVKIFQIFKKLRILFLVCILVDIYNAYKLYVSRQVPANISV